MHTLSKVDSIKDLDLVRLIDWLFFAVLVRRIHHFAAFITHRAAPLTHLSALDDEAALRVGHDEADLFRHLHQVRFYEKSGLT